MKLLNIIEATKVQEGSNDSYYAYHNAAEKWAKDTGQPKEKFAYAGVDVQDKYIEPEMKKYGLVPDSYQGKGVTKYRRENTEEGFPDYKMMTRGHDHNDKTCPVCKGSGNEKSYDELNNKPGHVYIQKPKPKCPSCDGTGKKIEEGEERSIIADACVEKLVDEFSGRENQFENKEDFEYAIYQALEDLDVEDCVDPDMEVGGQRIGDFASGRVIDCCSSSSIIYDVMANMDETQIGEGIFDKHSYDPVAPGGQSSKRKNLHATGDIVSLDGKEYVVTKVDLDKGTVDVVDRDGKRSPNVKAGVFSPGIKVGDKKSPTIGNFASDNRDPRLFDGKSPHKKGSAKYKKHMAAMHAESEEEGRWAIYIDGKDSQVRFKDYVDAGEMEDKMKKKHPEKDIVCKKVGMSEEIADPRKSDADQIIQQIIDGYGIDNLEDVFRQYYPQLSDEQVERFISKYKKPELKLVKTEDVDLNDDMIGEPDDFYDAEERTEAHKDLQNALQGNYMDDYIIDGYCPACGGSGYMDGEETFTNDDGEEEESSECDGFGNYGCDEGEMTYGSDGPSWVEIIKHDKQQADRKDQLANRPSDEELIPKVANMMKNMDDPRMAVRQVRIDYGYGPAKASDIVGKAFELLKQDEGLQFDEGTRCWKGYEKKGTKKMFGKTVPNCVKKEAIDKDTPCPACGDPKCDHKEDHINEGSLDGYYLAHRAKKLWLEDNPGKTERDYWQVGVAVQDEYTEKAGGIKGEYQGKGVSNWTVEEQVPYLQRPNSGYSKAIADYLRLNPGKSEDDFKELLPNQQEKYLNKYVEGKSPHKKGTAKYKKHMAAMHAENVSTDSSEADVSKMLAKALGDPNKWTEMSAPELYAELESRDTEFADAIKQVAKIVYGVKLEESK